jgi:hypothetical protein
MNDFVSQWDLSGFWVLLMLGCRRAYASDCATAFFVLWLLEMTAR